MIVEQRDYHVYTGKLLELVRLYESEGIPLQEEILGGLVGAFTTDIGALSTYTTLWRYDSFAEREVWLVIYNKDSGTPSVRYHDAIEHALCYGWIDSQARKTDPDSSLLRFTPRRPAST